MSAAEAVGIDVGATKILAVRAAADGTVRDLARRDTPRGPAEDLVAVLAELVGALRGRSVAVGLGLPGMVQQRTGALSYAPGLGFAAAPLRALVESATGLPTVADNDANAAAWAEYRLGAGGGAEHLALVTLGTGLGCGVVLGGRLLRGRHGYAAEASHLIVEPDGPPCACGARGCWGVVTTGRNLARLSRDAAATSPNSVLAALLDGGAPPAEAVTEAALRGDAPAVAILSEIGDRLGRGLAALANLFDPEVLVVGGGPAEAGEALLGPARAALRRWCSAAEQRPPIPVRPARFGVQAGAVGAALLALDAQRADPGGTGLPFPLAWSEHPGVPQPHRGGR